MDLQLVNGAKYLMTDSPTVMRQLMTLCEMDESPTENKWWDNSTTIDLYHGTSSALLDHIKEKGLQFPATDARELALDVLREFLPEEEWPEKLKQRVVQSIMVRQDDHKKAIYMSNNFNRAAGYARSYAKHGGEIAHGVWQWLTLHFHPRMKLKRLREKPPIKPRYPTAKPIVLKVSVPKEWCILHGYDSFDDFKERITQSYEHLNNRPRFENMSLEEFYNDVVQHLEIRVTRPIPASMILEVIEVTSSSK